MSKLATCLWFDGQAHEAAEFYVATFRACGQEASHAGGLEWGDAGPGVKGSALSASFTLAGQEFIGLNGGPHFTFTPAISIFIKCRDQTEVDAFWEKLTEGGAPGRCGWLTDRFGVSWQIVPTVLAEMLADSDRARADRVMRAMMQMTKLDVATLQVAYDAI